MYCVSVYYLKEETINMYFKHIFSIIVINFINAKINIEFY